MSKHSQSKHSQTVNGRWLGFTIPLHARFSTRPPVEGRPEFRAERRGRTNHSTSRKPQGWTGLIVISARVTFPKPSGFATALWIRRFMKRLEWSGLEYLLASSQPEWQARR